jgi:hypothetical protein
LSTFEGLINFKEKFLDIALAFLIADYNILPIGWKNHPPITAFPLYYSSPISAGDMNKCFNLPLIKDDPERYFIYGLGLVLGETSKNL